MKDILLVILVLTTFWASAQSASDNPSLSKIDSLLCPQGYSATCKPYLEFKLENRTSIIDNERLKGKVVLINFWFEGCHPCMAEMKALNNLYKELNGNKDFIFLSLTWENKEAIKRVKEKFDLSFEVFPTTAAECQRLNFSCGYPTSIILDKTGIVRFKRSGGSIEIEKATEFVEKILMPEIKKLL